MDYRDFESIAKGRSSGGNTRRDLQWWKMDPKEACDSISAQIQTLQIQQTLRKERLRRSMLMYDPGCLYGRGGSGARGGMGGALSNNVLTYNVAQSATDTLVSTLAGIKPEPFFLTSDGNYHQRRRAKRLNKFMRGVFYEQKAYDCGVDVFRDGLICGDGALHVFQRDGRVRYERELINGFYVDEYDAMTGKSPMVLHWEKEVDRERLRSMFPDAKQYIDKATDAKLDYPSGATNTSDIVTVRESWRLPSKPGAKDGRHIITVDAGPLTPMMKWHTDRFPFAFYRWNHRQVGFWSMGIPEQIESIQLAIIDLLWLIQQSQRLMGNPKILMEMGSQIAKGAFNNNIGGIIKYHKTPPQYLTHQIVAGELYSWVVQLKQMAYDQLGLSQLSATSQKPAGIDSAVGLREYQNIESRRFNVPGQRYEEFFVTVTELTLDALREAMEESGDQDYVVDVPDRRDAMKLSWKDVALDGGFITQCFPISSLPNSPAGRMQTVQEWVQAGWIGPDDAQRLLSFPDLAQRDTLKNAATEWNLKLLDMCVDEGRRIPPEPYNDLRGLMTLSYQYYNEGLLYDLEEERLELLRLTIADCQRLLKPPAPPTLMPQPAAPVPQAPPTPPQPSQFVPNVPQPAMAA